MDDSDRWEVLVIVNGENVLTIGTEILCGVPDLAPYEKQIREAARCLMSFIGEEKEHSQDIGEGIPF